jgi:hypothetical protein
MIAPIVLRIGSSWSWTSFATGAATGLVAPTVLRPAMNVVYRAAATIPSDISDAWRDVRAESAAREYFRRIAATSRAFCAPGAWTGFAEPLKPAPAPAAQSCESLTNALRDVTRTLSDLVGRIEAMKSTSPPSEAAATSSQH